MSALGYPATPPRMSLTCATTGQRVQLVQQIANSGEAEIWRTSRPYSLAKIYHHPTPERREKLVCMIDHAPPDPYLQARHHSLAWPESLLQNERQEVVGFLMPEIHGGKELLKICNPRLRKRLKLQVSWHFLHVTARNIAAIIQSIHQQGYVLGDIKLQNILVNNQALPSIIDTDSFQIKDPRTGRLYRCQVASEGFTPVELLGVNIPECDQEEVQDRFRLAVVIYHLLFGAHPFQGQWLGSSEPPSPSELIRQGFWPYAPNSLIQSSHLTVPLEIVNPSLQDHFLRCFNDGHQTPLARPTAQEWVDVLSASLPQLQACPQQERHFYHASQGHCYWCERARQLGSDIFDDQLQQASKLKLRRAALSDALPTTLPLSPASPLPPLPSYQVTPHSVVHLPLFQDKLTAVMIGGGFGILVSGLMGLYAGSRINPNGEMLAGLLPGLFLGSFTPPFFFFAGVYWWLCWSQPDLTEFLFKLSFYCGLAGGALGGSLGSGFGMYFAVLAGAGMGSFQALKRTK
jgi:DNA-binding helix-hairpin-helix protein with protein kinase domain